MAAKDIVTKEYMKDAEVFADAFNCFLYGGRQVIDPLKLHTMDTAEIGTPYGEEKTEAPVQKFRDGLKYLAAMEDGKVAYLVLGIENQTESHLAMPVRNMVYDALQYAAQVEKAAKSHRKAAKEQAVLKEEGKTFHESFRPRESKKYLSGFYKEDRLMPVITLVILFNPEPWDGPMSIHEMLAVEDEAILPFVPDYKINLIAPAQMDKAEMDQFKSSLREVLLYIKYSKDKEQLKELVASDERFRHVERKAAVVMNTITHSQIKIDEKEESVNMCQAIEEMRAEERLAGQEEGREEGREETAKRMLEAGKLSVEDIAEYAAISIERVKELKKEL